MSLNLLVRNILLVAMVCAYAHGQVTLSSLTGNNTAACPASGPLPAHCRQAFTGQQDNRPGVATPLFDPPAANVSDEDMHRYLNQGEGTRIFANFMLGFCTAGSGEYCHNNVRTGYDSNNDRTIAAQVDDLRRRHIDGAIMSWEGFQTSEDAAALKFQRYANAHGCSGPQQCNPMYLIMYDGPSTDYRVGSTGIPGTSGTGCGGRKGGDYENCVIAHIRNDMCAMNGLHFGNDAYLKYEGRPVLQVFPLEGVIPSYGPAPSWTDVWVHIEEWNRDLPKNCAKPPFNANNGVPMVVFEHASGFHHQGSAGAYYWVEPAGTDPATSQFLFSLSQPSTNDTLDRFLHAAHDTPQKMAWGGAFKGFNSSRSAWGKDRIIDQACGQVWVDSLQRSNSIFTSAPLPFLQIITWNDYNEGTEIETGIDNCYTVSAEVKGDMLTWRLASSNRFASLSTVSHIEVYDSSDGENLTLLGSVPAATAGTWDLSNLKPGAHQLYVRMVGKNSIQNRMSAAVRISK